MFLISAPAKCILFGEHSVVFGKKAIACSADLRTFCYAKHSPNTELHLIDLEINYNSKDKIEHKAVEAFMHLCSLLEISNISIKLKSEIPIGSGLGSSASYCVCISAALLLLKNRITETTSTESLNLINHYAFEGEKILHGNPSGLDNTICTFGGFKLFDKKSVEGIECPPLNFIVINSRIEKNTKIQVEKFQKKKDKYPMVMDPIVEAMGNIPLCFIDFLHQDLVYDRIEDLIELNQGLLCSAGMSNATIDYVVSMVEKLGFKSKITGAGGGGCILVYIGDSDPQELMFKVKELGMDAFDVQLGVGGVSVHDISRDYTSIIEMEFSEMRTYL